MVRQSLIVLTYWSKQRLKAGCIIFDRVLAEVVARYSNAYSKSEQILTNIYPSVVCELMEKSTANW